MIKRWQICFYSYPPLECQMSLIQFHSLVALHVQEHWSQLQVQDIRDCTPQAYTKQVTVWLILNFITFIYPSKSLGRKDLAKYACPTGPGCCPIVKQITKLSGWLRYVAIHVIWQILAYWLLGLELQTGLECQH